MRMSTSPRLSVLSWLVLASVVGCNESDKAGDELPAETRVVIQTADQRFESITPAPLDLYLGTEPVLELGVTGTSQGVTWAALVRLTADQAARGEIDVPLSRQAITTGAGILNLHESDQVLEWVTSGSLRATISKGRIVGSVEATPASFSGHFEGDLSISCWIPRAEPATGGGEALVIDEDFASPGCQPFKALTK